MDTFPMQRRKLILPRLKAYNPKLWTCLLFPWWLYLFYSLLFLCDLRDIRLSYCVVRAKTKLCRCLLQQNYFNRYNLLQWVTENEFLYLNLSKTKKSLNIHINIQINIQKDCYVGFTKVISVPRFIRIFKNRVFQWNRLVLIR